MFIFVFMKLKRPQIRLIIALGVGLYVMGSGIYAAIRESRESTAPADEKRIEARHPASSPSGISYGLDVVALPKGTTSEVKDYEGFRVSFNKDNRTPNWVAWELLGSETTGEVGRHNKFLQDPEVEGCPETVDYRKSGYDRGHMCPAADQKWSEKAMADCFFMTNICPQDHSLNSGAWNTLENKERSWARRDSALLIVAGPLYSENDKSVIGRGVRVPGAFFKVLAAPYLAEPRGIAFVYPNMSSPGNMQNYVMTIRDLEKITGYDFFPALPDALEDKIETTASFTEWNRR